MPQSSTGKNGNRKGPRRNKPRLDENGGLQDWELKPIILEGDWTFVTKNSVDFRGPKDKPGTKGQYPEAVQQSLTSR
ncbi:hypothetical protein [Sinorhizobium meliloti]|uniref:hypothetical protein n=1 Tax=Rhizobium meliloti TaxID=382 RepID=UPI0003F9D9E2|nr:hypothetical protein [Sinorhizobium meliloti]